MLFRSVGHTEVLAATSEKQLVRFEDGVPRDVCPLPFDAPEDLRVADTGRNGRLIAVSFDQGHVAAVWEDAFQVGCPSNVRSGVPTPYRWNVAQEVERVGW